MFLSSKMQKYVKKYLLFLEINKKDDIVIVSFKKITNISNFYNKEVFKMKKDLRLLFFCVSLVLMLAAGCATVESGTAAAGKDTAAAEVILGEKMLEAFVRNDSAAFRKHLTGDALKNFGEKEFRATRSQIVEAMGTVKSYEYLTALDAPGFRSHLWKVTFERGKTLKQDEKLIQETLFRIVLLSPEDEKIPPYIFTFGFL